MRSTYKLLLILSLIAEGTADMMDWAACAFSSNVYVFFCETEGYP